MWLDILGRSFNGMYLILETLTLLDVMAVPGFGLLGADLTPLVNVEAQRFWFLALVCGVAAGSLRVFKAFSYGAPAPGAIEGSGVGSKGVEKATGSEKLAEEAAKEGGGLARRGADRKAAIAYDRGRHRKRRLGRARFCGASWRMYVICPSQVR